MSWSTGWGGTTTEGAASSFYQLDRQTATKSRVSSTHALTDADQDVTDTYRYNAWGDILSSTDSTFNRHTWVGRERYAMSSNSALALLGLRYYMPGIGRFTTVDPLALLGLRNRARHGSRSPRIALTGRTMVPEEFVQQALDAHPHGGGHDTNGTATTTQRRRQEVCLTG